MVNSADVVMTIRELSAYLKVSRSTLYKLGQQGKVGDLDDDCDGDLLDFAVFQASFTGQLP